MLSSQTKRELKINQRRILIDSIEIGIPSSQQILTWAERRLPNGKKVGEIKNSKTVNYKKFTPLLDGLFCERIFGPVKSGICACGKKQPHKNMRFCEKCEVEYTDKNVRRYRLGYISLLSSVAHIWYLKGRPSYLSIFLGKRKKTVMALAYCNAYLIEQAFSPIKDNTESECRQDHGLEMYSKNIKSFTRTRHFATRFYKSEKFKSKKNFFSSTTQTFSGQAPFSTTPIRSTIEGDNNLSNTNNQFAQKNKREKAEIVNSFLYLLTHILGNSENNSATSISYAHYLSSVKDSNKSIVKRKLATILQKEEEKENKKQFKRSLRLLPNTLVNFQKQAREIDPDNFSKNKNVTLFSTEKLLENNNQLQDIKLRQIPIPKLRRTIGKKNTSINPKSFVESFSANVSIETSRSPRMGFRFSKGIDFDSNFEKESTQPGQAAVDNVARGENFNFQEKSSKVSPPENKLLCLLADTPQKGTNSYNRSQTLPFLPSLVCKYNLRDELLNIFNSSPLEEDTPIPLYCSTKRWQPLQDVHKFMAEQSFYQFNNLKKEAYLQTKSPFLKERLFEQNWSSKSPISSESLGVEQERLPINSLKRFSEIKFASGKPSIFKNTVQLPQSITPNYDIDQEIVPDGVREVEVKSVLKKDDLKSLRHILYKTLLKQKKLRNYNQINRESSQLAKNRFADSRLLLNLSTRLDQGTVNSAVILWDTLFSKTKKTKYPIGSLLFDTGFASEKANYLDQSVRTFKSYWKSYLLKSNRGSILPYLNGERELFQESLKEANIKNQFYFLKQAFELKGLASHLKINLQEKVKKSSTFSSLLWQNERYNTAGLNRVKRDFIPNTMFKQFFSNGNHFTFNKADIFLQNIYNENKAIFINRTAKNQVNLFEERLMYTVYNSLEDSHISTHSTVSPSATVKNASLSSFLILPETMRVVDYFNLLEKEYVYNPERINLKLEVPLEKDALLVDNVKSLQMGTFEKEQNSKKELQAGKIRHTTSLQVQLPNRISQFFRINLSTRPGQAGVSIGASRSSRMNVKSFESNVLSSNLDKSIQKRVSLTDNQWDEKRQPGRNKERELLSQVELTAIREILSYTGGGALKHLLERFDVQSFSTFLLTDIQITREAYTYREKAPFAEDIVTKKKILAGLSRRIYRNARRLKIAQLLDRSNRRPEWMMISTLPVLPPDLRPILQMSENLVVASDLNSLYQRVIYRNNRYYKLRLIDFHLVTAMQRLVQDAVDRLIENGKGGSKPFYTPTGRPLKSLSDTLKGKKGRFRLNLLGKRVDFSGRSVIVVSPHLKIHECGLPKEIALKLYTYFLLRQFMLKKQASSILIAKNIIKQRKSSMWDMLRDIIYYHPLLLNRAPTLHRLGIQAFQPRLVSGSAILLHPLVCSGFNADFDGDQMGVHLPLAFSARAEAWDLLWSRNNILSPATGEPVLVPSQDMVLGFYYMTASFPTRSLRMQEENLLVKFESYANSQKLPSGSLEKGLVRFLDGQYSRVPDIRELEFATRIFSHYIDVTRAFQNGHIGLHTPIWLKWDGKVENDSGPEVPLELRLNSFGSSTYIYPKYKRRNDEHLCYLQPHEENLSSSTIYTRTTVGRVLVNSIIFSCR
uniref:RNA polymerase beta' subunit n=1 Tax=Massjukichlorella minus TaxID=2650457 RepID=UPI0024112A1B|nr:RNA polymerase beta' subunit [Massjukichlorella minus]WDY12999.1 RNA polymerase beta' subunit [Massjukichlorella minus]